MVGLSTQSLNQFAEHVAQAEALSAEVAIILKGLHGVGVSQVGVESTSSKAGERMESVGMTRL